MIKLVNRNVFSKMNSKVRNNEQWNFNMKTLFMNLTGPLFLSI